MSRTIFIFALFVAVALSATIPLKEEDPLLVKKLHTVTVQGPSGLISITKHTGLNGEGLLVRNKLTKVQGPLSKLEEDKKDKDMDKDMDMEKPKDDLKLKDKKKPLTKLDEEEEGVKKADKIKIIPFRVALSTIAEKKDKDDDDKKKGAMKMDKYKLGDDKEKTEMFKRDEKDKEMEKEKEKEKDKKKPLASTTKTTFGTSTKTT